MKLVEKLMNDGTELNITGNDGTHYNGVRITEVWDEFIAVDAGESGMRQAGQYRGGATYVNIASITRLEVAGMGGNAGIQTLTVVIRALALGQISSANKIDLLRKELLVGLLNGLLFALVVGGAAVLWFKNWMLGAVIASAMCINMLNAALFGGLIPLVLKRMGVDPPLAGSVFLTTVTDVVGFFVFLGLASLILL